MFTTWQAKWNDFLYVRHFHSDISATAAAIACPLPLHFVFAVGSVFRNIQITQNETKRIGGEIEGEKYTQKYLP